MAPLVTLQSKQVFRKSTLIKSSGLGSQMIIYTAVIGVLQVAGVPLPPEIWVDALPIKIQKGFAILPPPRCCYMVPVSVKPALHKEVKQQC